MFAFYLVGYVAVAGLFYYRAYKTAPLMDDMEMETPMLTLWVNPELASDVDDLDGYEEQRRAA